MDFWIGINMFLVLGVIIQFFLPNKNLYVPVALLSMLTFFSAFRYAIGTDYFNYIRLYDYVSSSQSFLAYPEVSFQILSNILHLYGFQYQALFVIYSVLTSLFLWKGLKIYFADYTKMTIAISLWGIFLPGWWGSFNSIRQSLATSIFLWGSKYILEKKIFHYALICGLMASIHYSAMLLFFCYFWVNPIKKWVMVSLVAASLVLSLLGIVPHIINSVISMFGFITHYKEYLEINPSILGLASIIYIFVWGLFLCLGNSKNRIENFIMFMNTLGVCIMILGSFSPRLYRIRYYFDTYFVLTSVFFMYKFKEKVVLVALFILFLFSVWFCYGIYNYNQFEDRGNIQYKFNFELL